MKKAERNRKKDGTARLERYLAEFQATHDYHKDKNLPILLLCEILDRSRSGYYKGLMEKIKETFKKHNGNFGYRQMTTTINRKYKKQYNLKRVRRLMILLGLKSHIRRSNGYSTITSYVNNEENILKREFSAEKLNKKWVTDITHMKYGFGKKAYLSANKDLYDGSIVATKWDALMIIHL